MKDVKIKFIEDEKDLEELVLGDIVLTSELGHYAMHPLDPINYLVYIEQNRNRHRFITGSFRIEEIVELRLTKNSLKLSKLGTLRYQKDEKDSIKFISKDNNKYLELKKIMGKAGLKFMLDKLY